jgi:hypothetical protein
LAAGDLEMALGLAEKAIALNPVAAKTPQTKGIMGGAYDHSWLSTRSKS